MSAIEGSIVKRGVAASALVAALALAPWDVAAQESAEGEAPRASFADDIEIDISGAASVVAGFVDAEHGGDAAGDVDADVSVRGAKIFDNGLEFGLGLNARLDGQAPAQGLAGGRYTGLLIGGPRGIAPQTSDAYLRGAYAYARGVFGQVIVGRDEGVARTLAVTSPTLFRSFNVNDWRTDFSGLNDVHTVNDFSGNATKLSYLPPANFFGGPLGGLRLGVSYSPSLRECGERLCAPEDGFLIAPDGTFLSPESAWEDAVEAALYYQKPIRLGGDRLLLGVGASYVTADEATRVELPLFENYEAFALGLNLAYRGVTIGGSVKSSNAGLSTVDDDGYLAFDAGITFRTGEEGGDWGFMLGYGQSEADAYGPNPLDPTLFRDTQTAQAGVTYVIGRGVTIGAAAQYVEASRPQSLGGAEEATTLVIESSIKF